MISTMTADTYQQEVWQRTLPTAPFPRKYVQSVFDDLQEARQAAQGLRAAGYAARDIHILTNRDYVEAVERGQTLVGFLTSIDLDEYLHESSRGRHILAVRIFRYEQMEQVRDLIAPHHAHLVKYIDTWTVAELLP